MPEPMDSPIVQALRALTGRNLFPQAPPPTQPVNAPFSPPASSWAEVQADPLKALANLVMGAVDPWGQPKGMNAGSLGGLLGAALPLLKAGKLAEAVAAEKAGAQGAEALAAEKAAAQGAGSVRPAIVAEERPTATIGAMENAGADPDVYYFHGTSRQRLNGILKKGLRADKAGGVWDRSQRGSVYVTDSNFDARTWAHDAANANPIGSLADQPVVLKLDIPADHVGRFGRDRSSAQFNRYTYDGNMPKDWVVGYYTKTRDGWVYTSLEEAPKP